MAILWSCNNQENQNEVKSITKHLAMTKEIAIQNKASVKAFFTALENENVEALVSPFCRSGETHQSVSFRICSLLEPMAKKKLEHIGLLFFQILME